jgi:hypothetical protein
VKASIEKRVHEFKRDASDICVSIEKRVHEFKRDASDICVSENEREERVPGS